MTELTVHELADLPHHHPTLAEMWNYPVAALAERITVGFYPIGKCRKAMLALFRIKSHNKKGNQIMEMIALMTQPMLAAVGYSLLYLLFGGGLGGAVLIFFIAKMFGK